MNLIHPRSLSRPTCALILLTVLFLTLVLVSACDRIGPGPRGATVTPTLTLTATFPPTPTPTPLPLGSQSNPFVIGIVSEAVDPQIEASAGELASRIAELSGYSVIGQVYPSYAQLIEALSEGKVHATWMPPLTYLYASQHGLAEVVLLTNHFGVYQYGTQFMANVNSNFVPYYDPISGKSSADAATALAQFQDKRPCWVEPQSPSGYILPAGLLRLNNIPTQPGAVIQSHAAMVRALYIRGICDFGATYSIIGDPRTASTVQDDLHDVMDRVLIIWKSEASIPNINLSLLAGLSEHDRQVLTTAFTDLSSTPEGRQLLSLSAGNYQIDEIKPVLDEIYNPLRDVSKALEIDLKETIGK